MLRNVMGELFKTKKSLGQNFLNSPIVPKWLTAAGEVREGDTVVEIGPGTGALTEELLAAGAKVLALEADLRAIEVLNDKFRLKIDSGQLEVRHLDVRKLDIKSLDLNDHSFKVVSNIPYYLTGQLFRIFLSGPVQPSRLVFLVQKEVAKRATARLERGEKESLLSLSIKVFGEPEYVRTVGRGHFTPAPGVDSAIISVKNINRSRFQNISSELFFETLHLGFGSKRKQLLGNLAKVYDRQALLGIFSHINLSQEVRAEDLPLDKWLSLTEALQKL